MDGMADDADERVTAAAAAFRAHEVTADRCRDLAEQIDRLSLQRDELHAALADRRDEDRGWLSGLLSTFRGHRAEALGRRRPERDIIHDRLADTEAQLRTTRDAHDAALARLRELASAPAAYRAVLADHRQLSEPGDPRAARLLALADECGRLHEDLTDLDRALRAVDAAEQAIEAVDRKLGGASGWSTVDILSRGSAADVMKYTYMDEAADLATHADRCLAALRTELVNVEQTPAASAHLTVDPMTWSLDVGWDTAVTDVAVDGRIDRARDNLAVWAHRIRRARERLEQRVTTTRERLTTVETERGTLLTGPADPVRDPDPVEDERLSYRPQPGDSVLLTGHVVARISDDVPGWVRVQVTDAAGNVHHVVDKEPIFDTALGPQTALPAPAAIPARMVATIDDGDPAGPPLILVTTAPHGVATDDGTDHFTVRGDQLRPRA
jgi:hypothetical protein